MIKTRILFGEDGMVVEKEILELSAEEEIELREYERSLNKCLKIDDLNDSLISPELN